MNSYLYKPMKQLFRMNKELEIVELEESIKASPIQYANQMGDD